MSIEEALVTLEISLGRRLSRIEELIVRQAWDGQSYSEIAVKCSYDLGYVKNVGSKLWQTLSKTLGEKVTKNNLQSVLKRRAYSVPKVVALLASFNNEQFLS